MHKINLSHDEREILLQYFKTSSLKLVRDKAQIIVMRDRGLKISDIAYSLGKSVSTVDRALNA